MLRIILLITIMYGTVCTTYAQKRKRHKVANSVQKTDVIVDTVNYRAIGAPMPALDIITKDNVMIFGPECDHCQAMTLELEKNIAKFKKTDIVMICHPSLKEKLDFFNNITRHHKYANIYVGIDSAGFIPKTYPYGTLPYINVYDKDRKLIKTFTNEASFKDLEPYVE
jgi:excinuclease UvrABC ATPase subunit